MIVGLKFLDLRMLEDEGDVRVERNSADVIEDEGDVRVESVVNSCRSAKGFWSVQLQKGLHMGSRASSICNN